MPVWFHLFSKCQGKVSSWRVVHGELERGETDLERERCRESDGERENDVDGESERERWGKRAESLLEVATRWRCC